MSGEEMDAVVQRGEHIGAITSPSTSTTFLIDVMESAYESSLVGNFCVIPFKQEGRPTYALGQIVSLELTNPYLEGHSVRKIVSVRGTAPPLTGVTHDVKVAEILVTSTFALKEGQLLPSTVGTVPQTGTEVYKLNQPIVDKLVELRGSEREKISFVGQIYNTDILAPMCFEHFGKGGLGEAYHLGIFGKTGSGKSYMARMIISCYARHPEMSIFVFDTVGEYSDDIRKGERLGKIMSRLGRPVFVYSIGNIRLCDPRTLSRILLRSQFMRELGVFGSEYEISVAEYIERFLDQNLSQGYVLISTLGQRVSITDSLALGELLAYLDQNLNRIYGSPQPIMRVRDRIRTNFTRLHNIWRSVATLFEPGPQKVSVEDIAKRLGQGEVIFLDLSVPPVGVFWDPSVQAIALAEIVERLRREAEDFFRRGERMNLLVVLEEAHRFIPRERPEDEDLRRLKERLVVNVFETRKYGLGWFFISPTANGLEQRIMEQLRIYFFGYGLSWGAERRAIETFVGGGKYGARHMDLYTSFADPRSTGRYPFMVYGPVSPLSVSGAPIFLEALDFNLFLEKNGHWFTGK
ncbi:MAG: DUF87 domain-containing protein [Candidatus Hadarchaeales archaeon]